MTEIKATNVTWHEGRVSREERQKMLRQRGATVWFTGLSGSGKSSIAFGLEQLLMQRGHLAFTLDGDNIRHGLNKNLGFSAADREENIRRIGEVAKLFCEAGLIACTSFISPYRKDRDQARKLHQDANHPFIEVFVDVPIEICETRDPKGLYQKARAALAAGKGMGFTGVDDPYEPPLNPEIVLKNVNITQEAAARQVLDYLESKGIILK